MPTCGRCLGSIGVYTAAFALFATDYIIILSSQIGSKDTLFFFFVVLLWRGSYVPDTVSSVSLFPVRHSMLCVLFRMLLVVSRIRAIARLTQQFFFSLFRLCRCCRLRAFTYFLFRRSTNTLSLSRPRAYALCLFGFPVVMRPPLAPR